MRILVVRRDNIGDLVCTTPLIAALRHQYPKAWLGALVNSYNAPVLAGNPNLDEVIAYRKTKHLDPGESVLGAFGARIAALWRLRRSRLDWVVLATPDVSPRLVRLARWLAPARIAGFSDGSAAARGLDAAVPLATVRDLHEVERVFALAPLLGVSGPIPPMKVVADPAERARAAAAFGTHAGPRVAVQLSARRPSQRWPAERWAELIRVLAAQHGARVMLLWSPGTADDPRHPGDDEKAAAVVQAAGEAAPIAWRTARLEQLIAALDACDSVITPDGGALHLAAALGKPVAALFGDSPPERWRPWGVGHCVLRAESLDVGDLDVEAVRAGWAGLVETAPRIAVQ